jgi:hypothetical protein
MTLDRSTALCSETDPETWFPEQGAASYTAVRLCFGCDLRVECLLFALANNERYGVWGGTSGKTRRWLARQPVQGCAPPPAIAAVPDLSREPSRAMRHHRSQPGRSNTGVRVA